MAEKKLTKSVAKNLRKIKDTRKQIGGVRTLAKEASKGLDKANKKIAKLSTDMKAVFDAQSEHLAPGYHECVLNFGENTYAHDTDGSIGERWTEGTGGVDWSGNLKAPKEEGASILWAAYRSVFVHLNSSDIPTKALITKISLHGTFTTEANHEDEAVVELSYETRKFGDKTWSHIHFHRLKPSGPYWNESTNVIYTTLGHPWPDGTGLHGSDGWNSQERYDKGFRRGPHEMRIRVSVASGHVTASRLYGLKVRYEVPEPPLPPGH